METISFWRRMAAYFLYAWGMSMCYWGISTADRSFFRAGIGSFQRAIRVWPEFAGAYYRSGLIRGRELNEYPESIVDLSRAIELSPEWPEPYLQRGLFRRFRGEYPAALQDLQHYLDLGGESHWRAEAERQIRMIRMETEEM